MKHARYRSSTMHRIVAVACAAALLAPATVWPQAYPAKLIRVVTGSTAGGAADVTARQIVPRLAEVLKIQIIVDNRPGVAGMIANEHVSKAAPDGYTLLLQPGSFVSTGVGSNFHLAGELFKVRAKVDMWHVPYKGVEFTPGTPEHFAARLKQEYEKTAAMIREAGVKPEF